jgi:uncharacterized membrane protein
MEYIPQNISNRRPRIFWFALATGAMLILALVVGAPLARASNHGLLSLALYKGFSAVCHQIPERSFYIAGYPFAVCARCTGLYVGFTGALLIYPLVVSLKRTYAPARKWLLLAAIPLLVDVALNFFGIWENTHTSRFITGALLGAVAVFYVMPGISDLALRGFQFSSGKKIPTATLSPDPIPAAPSDYSAPHRRI